MDIISYSKAKKAEALAKSADARLTQALKDSKPIDQVSDALVDSKGNKSDTLKKRLDSRDVSVDASLNAINTQLGQSNRTTQVLQTGVNVVNSEVAAPATFQIEGRTLVNMGNSDLQDGRYYVLADKKTKVKTFRDDAWKQGVAKFQRENSLTTKSDFTGKVAGSVVENPHKAFRFGGNSFSSPAPLILPGEGIELVQSNYTTNFAKVDGDSHLNRRPEANNQAQTLFSFNVIEHIERKAGLIPKSTLAEKVQWVKDNVYLLRFEWWGKGSAPAGNKAEITMWYAQNTGSWGSFNQTHTSNMVSKLSLSRVDTAVKDYIDANGMFHCLAFADPSNGVVASSIETDYASLEVQLRPNVQLNKRPIFSRVANFEGKITGSTVENPHVAKYLGNNLLQPPSGPYTELLSGLTSYDKVRSLDGDALRISTTTNGNRALTLFSFNVIEEMERNIGKIPGNTLLEKRNWIRERISSLNFKIYAHGNGPNGNNITASVYRVSSNDWNGITKSVTSSSPSLFSITETTYAIDRVDLNGFVHLLLYADPSDGVIASTVYTDYVELEIELKPEAVVNNPIAPLYEVPKAEYDQILLGWNEAELLRRYPKVEGMQHVQNPGVMAEGENLLPPFSEWSLHANARIVGPYELELNATSQYQGNAVVLTLPENTQFTINTATYEVELGVNITAYDASNSVISTPLNTGLSGIGKSFTTPAKTKTVKVTFFNISANRLSVFKEPSLVLGIKHKPFVPRTPSYLFTQVKLGQIGDKKDVLYKDNNDWKVRREIEKDVILDGKTDWGLMQTYPGFKRFSNTKSFPNDPGTDLFEESLLGVKSNGFRLQALSRGVSLYAPDQFILQSFASGGIKISVSNSETGFGESYSPISEEIRAYFNGWKVKSVDANGKPTAWISTVDGSDSPTQTLNYVKDNYVAGYNPHKISYSLLTPKNEVITDKVEGGITLSGSTQVEVTNGIISREKTIPVLYNNSYYISNIAANRPKYLNYKNSRILKVFKNGVEDNKWIMSTTNGYGNFHAQIPKEEFDATAEYSVTYVVLEKEKFSTNAVNTKAVFAQNLRDAHDDLAKQLKDTSTQLSITNKMLIDLYVQYKALKP